MALMISTHDIEVCGGVDEHFLVAVFSCPELSNIAGKSDPEKL
jgi:hypothetical protein